MVADIKKQIIVRDKDIEQPQRLKQSSLVVTGLHCSSCALAIERALKRTPGVEDAELTFATEKLIVTHDPAAIGTKGIKEVVQNVGFGALEEVRRLRRGRRHTYVKCERPEIVSSGAGRWVCRSL
jgi:copper chaperone CopZ